MLQTFLTYLIVAAAAAWLIWSMFLPNRVRHALRSALSFGRAAKAKPAAGCGTGASCHCDPE